MNVSGFGLSRKGFGWPDGGERDFVSNVVLIPMYNCYE